MNQTDVLLIFPKLGLFDEVARDIPLSLIYAATHSVKKGFKVKLLDLRIHGVRWQEVIDAEMEKGCSLVGLSVMTGIPIITSLNISQYIKNKYGTLIVWGGPHPTILPEQTLENEAIDFVVRHWGSESLSQLVEHVLNGTINIEDINGLGYKKNGQIYLNSPRDQFEVLDFEEIPYDLVNINANQYNRLKSGKITFPIYTSMGCPWHCTFCMSPSTYQVVKGKKWRALDVDYVLGHIAYLGKRYPIETIQDYADESFINLDRMYNLLRGYIRNDFNALYTLDFRGVRINDLDRMDDDYLQLMVKANVRMMFIGVESGSDRILEVMGKNISREQTLRVNRKLARYPSLKPHYNFFYGIPGETIESLKETSTLIEQLASDHPGCYVGGAGVHWKPIPGSKITEIAVNQYGYKLPTSLKEWANIDTIDAEQPVYPWYSHEMPAMINLLGLASSFLDAKATDFSPSFGPIMGKIAYSLILGYRPFLKLRLKYHYTNFLFEERVRNFAFRNIGWLLKSSC